MQQRNVESLWGLL